MKLKRCFCAYIGWIVILLMAGNCQCADELERVLHASKMSNAPKIDGVINENEWSDACAVTGFRGALFATAYPECLRMVWYIGYDDKNLYLAMDAAFPESIFLKADAKTPDQDNEYALILDDHVEIEVSPHSRRRATQAGYGFYKMMVNPRGVFSDVWYLNGTVGTEVLWSSAADVKCLAKDGHWQMEIAWPLASMKIKNADNTELLVQLCRAVSGVGWYFAAWAPGSWMDFGIFYRVILDPDAPSMQFLRHGEIVKDDLDALVRLKSRKEQKIQLDLNVSDGKGTQVFSDARQVSLKPGEPQDVVFKKSGLPLTPEPEGVPAGSPKDKNIFDLKIKTDDTMLYTHSLSFIRFTPEYEDRYLNDWLKSRPAKGEYKILSAYYPSKGLVRITADLDVYGGLPEKFKDAKKLKASVVGDDGKELAQSEYPIENLVATGLLKVGDLPAGKYGILFTLLDGQGKALDSKKDEFSRKKYEWEGNKVGMERVVIPPFRPLEVNGSTIKTRCSAYTFGKGGLPERMEVLGENILAAPMRIECTVGGKTQAWVPDNVSIENGKGRFFTSDFDQYDYQKNCPVKKFDELPETDGYDAIVRSTGKTGDLGVKVEGRMEYDGWYGIKMELDPAGKTVKIDSLDLVIPLWKKADVMSAGRGEDIIQKIPEGENVVWESSQFCHQPKGFHGTFVPAIYAGNGGKGLWFKAESDEGWMLDDSKSCVFFERNNGSVSLRLRFVNKPAELKTKRTIEFAFQTTPAKPRDELSRRMLWGYPDPTRIWFNTGWCLYGWGGDDFWLPSDNDYKELGRWLLHPEQFDSIPPKKHITLQREDELKAGLDPAKVPIVLYSSHYIISASLPELETFCGEWAGKNKLEPNRDYFVNQTVVGKGTDFTGKFLWDTPQKCSELAPEWNQQLIDCYLWYYSKIVGLAGTNGTFWDNASLIFFQNADIGNAYVRDDGSTQAKNNLFVRRQVSKRLHTMGWLLGKPPFYLPNSCTYDFPFAESIQLIEGPWYISSREGDLFDGIDMDIMRGGVIAKGIPSMLCTVHVDQYPYGFAGLSNRQTRSVMAVAVLNDISASLHCSLNIKLMKNILDSLDKEIGFLKTEKQAEFLPYWDNTSIFRFTLETKEGIQPQEPRKMYASVYRQNEKALLWLVNAGETEQTSDLWLDEVKLIGKKAVKLRDMETGEEMLPLANNGKDGKRDGIWTHVSVRPHDFRALILE